MEKPSGGDLKLGTWNTGVMLNFASLTCFHPLAYILINAGPNIACSDQLLCCFDAQVGKIVKGGKNGTAKCLRDEWSGLTSRNVAGNGVG